MLDSARCILRNGDPERAATHVEGVLGDFAVLLDRFADDAPFDEHVVALEYLQSAIELIIEVRGSSTALDSLLRRTKQPVKPPRLSRTGRSVLLISYLPDRR